MCPVNGGFTVKFSKIKEREKRGDEESSSQKRSINYSLKPKKIKNNRQIICELNFTQALLEKIIALKIAAPSLGVAHDSTNAITNTIKL